jgi:serine/threonine-protein kinase
MVTTELGACEWFVWDVRRSNLIDRGQLDQIISDFLQKNPRAEPLALSEYLVSQGFLSQFQAERLLQGKTQGFVLGPFTLVDALGSGSMGTVYKARSKNDNAYYAVKVLPRRSMWNVRIARRKVRAFEQCRHPAVVPFVDVGTSGNTHYLVWNLVEGETLHNLVQRQGRLAPELAAYYVQQVAEGLDVCHQQNLFHGLLKPSNLMIGPNHQVHILDLGIGCLLAETEGESLVDTMSTANSVTSGLDCASPESIMEPTNLTPTGDQYSLGCVLYYCLVGRYPFPEGSAAEKMMAHQLKQPTPLREINPQLPHELTVVVERLMQKSPEGRYGGMAEVVEALAPLAQTPSARFARGARPGPARENLPDPIQKKAAPFASKAPAAPSEMPGSASPRGPAASSSLPSRQSLREPAPAAKGSPAAPARGADATPSTRTATAVKPIPGDSLVNGWEKYLAIAGIALGALAAFALAWLAMSYLI